MAISNVTPATDATADKLTVNVNVMMPESPSTAVTLSIERSGAGAWTVVTTVAELFAVFESAMLDVTAAVLMIVVPTAPCPVATSVIVSDAPAASELNVIVRLLPEPPQTPAPVELHETNVTESGKLSVTTRF